MRRGAICAALAAVAFAAAGCGDDDEGTKGPAKLTVQLVPVSDVVPIHLGIKKGFFREEDLDLVIQTAQGGAEVIPQVLNGDVQIGYSNLPSLLIAAAKGLPIQVVAPGGGADTSKRGKGENLVAAVMVKKDSPIRAPEDLAGKTVAINALKNLSDVTTSAALDKRGIDHTTVKYLEVPFPDMLAALDADRVDAVFTVSPFKTLAERTGKYRSVLFPLLETKPGLVGAAYLVSERWASENEEVLERFLSALRKSMRYAASHEGEMRRTLADYTELPKDLIPTIPIGERNPSCDEPAASAKFLADAMVRYDALEKSPDLDELIRPGFCAA